MIKPIQLLKDSFATYKANIKNIIFMTWPIALLPVVVQSMIYYNINWFVNLLMSAVSFVISIVIGLYLQPAIYRALQKKEDGEVFDIKAAYNFQKKNIWNFIMTGVWYVLYLIWVLRYYVLIGLAVSFFIIPMIYPDFRIVTTWDFVAYFFIHSVTFFIPVIIGYLINLSKFLFYVNIFFSKNIKPREVVRESIRWGNIKGHSIEAWKTFFSIILFMLLTTLVYVIVSLILNFFKIMHFEQLVYIGNQAAYTDYKWFIINSVSNIFKVMFILPVSFIILAKAYTKLFDGQSSLQDATVEGELVSNE